MHWSEVRQAGALHVDDQAGPDLQAGVRRDGGGERNDQVCHCPGQAGHDQLHQEKLASAIIIPINHLSNLRNYL